MDKEAILEALNIRYTDLRFVLEFSQESFLPRYKASALRGGMGQMLLEQYCVSDGKCEQCSFVSECPVRRMMYAKYEIQPRIGGQGESNGYIIECENHKEYFREGERLEFHLLLFGKTIVWFSQFLQAFYMLGQAGLGKEKARFEILRVENEQGDFVMNKGQVCLGNLGISSVRSYAERRARKLQEEGCQNILQFISPLTVKYEKEILHEFNAKALIRSIFRRVYCFNCFEGQESELMMWDSELPQIISQRAKQQCVRRYSSTQDSKMNLYGITGFAEFDFLPEELLLMFAAGEKLHLGKNTSFGFGKYVVK